MKMFASWLLILSLSWLMAAPAAPVVYERARVVMTSGGTGYPPK